MRRLPIWSLCLLLVGCEGVLQRGDPLPLDPSGGQADSGPLTPPPPPQVDGGVPAADVTPPPPAPDSGPVGPVCGDGQCNGGETTASCAQDCPAPPPPPPPPGGIWQPKPGTSWQWQLSGTVDTSVNVTMYDIDLFDASAATITKLHNDGRIVICYFSAGSYESWRPDASSIPSAARGKKMDGWDELWLDVRNAGMRAVMAKRLDLAKSKGCDGVEPDNIDGYTNDTGFPLKGADQLDYNKFLAAEAHARGLSIGLKNDIDQAAQLVSYFDWALNEQCMEYDECDTLKPFINAGKAVFHVEYSGSQSSVCSKAKALKFDTLIKHLDLDAWRQPC